MNEAEDAIFFDIGGGHLMPKVLRVRRPGVRAWLLRLFRREEGWDVVDLYDQLVKLSEDIATLSK